jgi:hypothetical protein
MKRLGKVFPSLIFQMKKIQCISFAIIFVLLCASVYAGTVDSNYDSILSSAESLFTKMKDKDYPKIWMLLTQKSKNTIIDDVYKAEAKAGIQHSKEQIKSDFSTGGFLSSQYWNNYIDNFNPEIVLEQSKWEMGKIDRGKAEIIIRYKKSERPAEIKMFKEDGVWKVGLVETFWTSKR